MRVDRWLWSVRLAPSRSAATQACAAGRVQVNDEPTKPARRVRIDDVVSVQRDRRLIVVRVGELIDRRVGAPVAVTCYEDLSPPPPDRDDPSLGGPVAGRTRGAGRPTKRDRRRIDRWRGR